MEKIVIGNDHAAIQMKNEIKEFVETCGYEVINVGIDENIHCDYPDYAFKACKKINDGSAKLGILICGTGLGMSIAANKIKGIRAACCSDSYSARLTREHNDANVICFGARVVGIEIAKEIVKAFLNAKFLGEHHINRINKIKAIEDGTYNDEKE